MSIEIKCKKLRKRVLGMMLRMDAGHPGSILSLIEVVTVLYHSGLTSLATGKPKNERDKLIISKGHATQAVYPLLEDFGYVKKGSCDIYGTKNHNEGPFRVFGNTSINGIDCTTGSLGHGIGVGSGYALSDKRRGNEFRTYVLISEGEQYEGSTWEAALFASHYKLANLVVIIDRNKKIILGDTEACLALEPVRLKWEAFGWETSECNGHDVNDIIGKLQSFECNEKPKLLIANTVKGKGVDFMENKPEWHYWISSKREQLKEYI